MRIKTVVVQLYYFRCSFDSLEIINNRNQEFGIYCGAQTGRKVIVTGEYVLVIFRTDFFSGEKGFLLHFDAVPTGRLFFGVCSFYYTLYAHFKFVSMIQ